MKAGGGGVAGSVVDRGRTTRAGLLYGLGAYLWWGFMPLYFSLLAHVRPMAVVSFRIVGSVVFLLAIVAGQNRWRELRAALASRRTLGGLTLSALFISTNWVVYIFAVVNKQVMQAALGYYINPLVFVVLALVFLGERLRPLQWASAGIAAVGVAVATVSAGGVPWIALTLALSFALYGFSRKLVDAGPMIGLLVETLVLLPVALIILVWGAVAQDGGGPLKSAGWAGWTEGLSARDWALLLSAGVFTAVPLLWFASSVRRLRLSTLGFIQYVSPTTKFLVAIYGLHEPLDAHKLVSFAFIWVALGVFTWDAWRTHRQPGIVGVEAAE